MEGSGSSYLELYSLVTKHCRPPDHSVLTCELKCKGVYTPENNRNNARNKEDVHRTNQPKKFIFENIPSDFMSSETWKGVVRNLIAHIESMRASQSEVDKVYSEFCGALFAEMDKYLNCTYIGSKSRKRLRNSKPY